jgi:hypothetical protein
MTRWPGERMNDASLSILVPLHRSKRFIEVTSRNIAVLHRRFRLVISDATVEDDTLRTLQDMYGDNSGILWLGKRDLGGGWVNHYNDLRERAQTPYFAWLAHDDEAGCGYYDACLAALEADRRLCGAVGHCVAVRGNGLRSIAQPLVADAPGLAGLEPSAEEFLLHWNLGVLFRAVFRKSMTLPIEHTTESDEWADIVWAYGLCLEHPFVQLPSVTYSKRYYRESTHAGWRPAFVPYLFRYLVAEATRTATRWSSVDFDKLFDTAWRQSVASREAERRIANLQRQKQRYRNWLSTVLWRPVAGRRKAG